MGYGYSPHRMGMHPIGLALKFLAETHRGSQQIIIHILILFDLVTSGIHDIDCSDRASMNGGRW